jgi:hypothetical protein
MTDTNICAFRHLMMKNYHNISSKIKTYYDNNIFDEQGVPLEQRKIELEQQGGELTKLPALTYEQANDLFRVAAMLGEFEWANKALDALVQTPEVLEGLTSNDRNLVFSR